MIVPKRLTARFPHPHWQGASLLIVSALVLAGSLRHPAVSVDGPPAPTPVERLTGLDTVDKYASVAVDSDGHPWIAWASMRGDKDAVLVRNHNGRSWSDAFRVSSREGLEGLPVVTTDADGMVHVFWTAQRDGNWDIYGRSQRRGVWNDEIRVTEHGGADLNPAASLDSAGRVWLAWESDRNGNYDIYVKRFESGRWTAAEPVTHDPADERRAALTASLDGTLWLAWDSAANRNYDVYLASWKDGNWSAARRVTHDDGVDDSPALAADPETGDVWIAWNSTRDSKTSLPDAQHNYQDVFVRCLRAGRWFVPAAPPGAVHPGQVSTSRTPNNIEEVASFYRDRPSHGYPHLLVAPGRRLWVFWRADVSGGFKNFDVLARSYASSSWSDELVLSSTSGRDQFPSAGATRDGAVWVAWQGQEDWHQAYNIYASRFDAPPRSGSFVLTPFAGPADSSGAGGEAALRPRQHRTIATSAGTLSAYFGDTHSHTAISDAKVGLPDQMYVLARDAAGFDFHVLTDHADFGRLSPTEWALARTLATYFTRPDRFIAFSGFEWNTDPSMEFGHRCVIYPTDDQPVFGGDDPRTDTIQEFWAAVDQTNGLMSAHHIGMAPWGRWNPVHHEPRLEPNLEMTSVHGRFEYYGNPYNEKGRTQVPGHSYQDALARGQKVGAIGGSDTHHLRPGYMGLTAVWARSLSRDDIFEALRSRRVYATTGSRIVLDFRVDDHLMGEEYVATGPPVISATVEGEAPIAAVDLVRNNEVIANLVRFQDHPKTGTSTFLRYSTLAPQAAPPQLVADSRTVTFTFRDEGFDGKPSFYYLRVTQSDREQAWSSPVWVRSAR